MAGLLEVSTLFCGACAFVILITVSVKIGAMLLKHTPIRSIKVIAGRVNSAIKW